VKLVHKLDQKSQYLFFKRWHRQSLAIESAKAIQNLRDEQRTRLIRRLVGHYSRSHMRFGLVRWIKRAKEGREGDERRRVVGIIKVIKYGMSRGSAR
jgi:uncharacterized protein (DUF2252 family)